MPDQNYNCTFTVGNTPFESFDAIGRVSEWWSTNTSGSSKNMGDRFTVRFGETSVDFEIVESIPDKKIVWLVTNCFLHWLHDKKEWKNTRLVFDITKQSNGTTISMTHIGIMPGIECYESCKKGWDFFSGESLRKLITEKKGQPDATKANR